MYSANFAELQIDIAEIMAVQKQNMSSFASVMSVLSIVFYCAGFIRVELELHDHKKRINALESIAETRIKNAPGKCTLCHLKFRSCVEIKEYKA